MSYVLHYAPDNASLIIRLALDELGATYRTQLVDRSQNAQKSQTYLAINPAGKIPVLETPEGPIFETAAILLWLSQRHAGLTHLAKEGGQATLLKWLFFISNTLHPDLVALFYPHRYAAPDALADFNIRTQERLTHNYVLLNAAAHQWGAGADRTNIIEIYLATCLRWCQLYPVGGADWFALNRWSALAELALKMDARPATQKAIMAEGLNPTPFSAADYAQPPEGSAT